MYLKKYPPIPIGDMTWMTKIVAVANTESCDKLGVLSYLLRWCTCYQDRTQRGAVNAYASAFFGHNWSGRDLNLWSSTSCCKKLRNRQ